MRGLGLIRPLIYTGVAFWVFGWIPACSRHPKLTLSVFGLSGSWRNREGRRVEELVVVLAVQRDHRGPSLLSGDAWCGGGRRRRQAVVLVCVRKRRGAERDGGQVRNPDEVPRFYSFLFLFFFVSSLLIN